MFPDAPATAHKKIQAHVEHLRARPPHVRERIAYGATGLVTAVVAVAWFAAMATSGVWSLGAQSTTQLAADSGASNGLQNPSTEVQSALGNSRSVFSSLAGAGAAAIGASSSPATITVVNTDTSSTLDRGQQPTATSIPF